MICSTVVRMLRGWDVCGEFWSAGGGAGSGWVEI